MIPGNLLFLYKTVAIIMLNIIIALFASPSSNHFWKWGLANKHLPLAMPVNG
ncbi:MAG: hypothetical protein WKF36_04060 [Candidatus Nitrosocosmicus sp.]